MRVVSAEAIDAALTFPDLIAALDDAFRGDIVAPTRHHHRIARPDGDATLLLMPAWTGADAEAALGVKVVSVFPGNAARALPSVLGAYLLMDGASGQPLAVMDGARLTLWRTAAASALAASRLARPDASRLLMCGAGALAPFLIRAHRSVRPIREIRIWNHRPETAQALAARLRQEGIEASATADLEGAVAQADLVSCATLATAPFLRGAWLRPGTHVDLVGAFNLSMREADDEALTRADLFVDTHAALTEGGDIAIALRAGQLAESAVQADLAALCAGRHSGRMDAAAITLFKSVGAALEDLAAAHLVWRRWPAV